MTTALDEFKPITTGGDWMVWDQLDGRNLEDGERLLVLWPDGTTEEHAVILRRYGEEISDMGSPYTLAHGEAYVSVPVRGSAQEIRLAGAGVRARRIPLRSRPPCDA